MSARTEVRGAGHAGTAANAVRITEIEELPVGEVPSGTQIASTRRDTLLIVGRTRLVQTCVFRLRRREESKARCQCANGISPMSGQRISDVATGQRLPMSAIQQALSKWGGLSRCIRPVSKCRTTSAGKAQTRRPSFEVIPSEARLTALGEVAEILRPALLFTRVTDARNIGRCDGAPFHRQLRIVIAVIAKVVVASVRIGGTRRTDARNGTHDEGDRQYEARCA